MKVDGNKIIFEKLVEANPRRRQGEIEKTANQAVSVRSIPEPAEASSCVNARGSFSNDITSLFSGMKSLSNRASELNLKQA